MGEQEKKSGPGASKVNDELKTEPVEIEQHPEHMDSDVERSNIVRTDRAEQMSYADTPSDAGAGLEVLPNSEKTDPRVVEELNESNRGDDYL